SGRLFGVSVLESLLPHGLDHVRGIQAIPQAPIGFRPPHLVEHRLELAVQVGCVGLCSEPHHSSPTSKTRTEPIGDYHYWMVSEFHEWPMHYAPTQAGAEVESRPRSVVMSRTDAGPEESTVHS